MEITNRKLIIAIYKIKNIVNIILHKKINNDTIEKNNKRKIKMEAITLIYLLVFIVFALIATAVLQIRMAGIKVKDFWGFIQANQMLDQLYKFSKRYKLMSPQEQVIFLAEAEKVFDAYDKIPSIIWEDEYRKYSEVLQAYQNVRVTRWSEQNTVKNSK